MPNLLKKLQLTELSLVDRPANAQAMVSLFKRDTSEEEITKMTDEMEAKVKAYMTEKGATREEAMKNFGYDMEKAEEVSEEVTDEVTDEVTEKAEEAVEAEEVASEIDTLKADLERLSAENQHLRKGLIDEGYVIRADSIEKKAPVETLLIEGVEVNKADIPAPVLKALEAADLIKADVELTKSAVEILPHFAEGAAKTLLKSFSEDEAIMEMLKAADAAFAASMQEFGKSDVDGEFASSTDKLDSLVKSYMDENQLKKSEFAKAYAAVAKTDAGKALINKSYKGE